MPVEVAAPVRRLSDREFDHIDEEVMGHAYDLHNGFGKLCDERVYENEIAFRVLQSGLASALTQVGVTVTHRNFRKDYYLDLLVEQGAIIELKKVKALTDEHKNQLLNYLLLCGLKHGKLVNMGGTSVEGKRVFTPLTPEARRKFNVIDGAWSPRSRRAEWLKRAMLDLLEDWGAFLSVSLYLEAICLFLGGPEKTVRKVEFFVGSRVVARQNLHMLDKKTAFVLSALTRKRSTYEEHLLRLLRHTRLDAIQWINMRHHDIHFKTLINDAAR